METRKEGQLYSIYHKHGKEKEELIQAEEAHELRPWSKKNGGMEKLFLDDVNTKPTNAHFELCFIY